MRQANYLGHSRRYPVLTPLRPSMPQRVNSSDLSLAQGLEEYYDFQEKNLRRPSTGQQILAGDGKEASTFTLLLGTLSN